MHRLRSLGVRVLINDPPLQRLRGRAASFEFTPLGTLLEECDVLTLHVPLTVESAHPTYHLIGSTELDRLKRNVWLINTSRGGVVDESALRRSMEGGRVTGLVLDVWETEPEPDPWLHEHSAIATPHIAGYSIDAKRAATEMIFNACQAHFSRIGGETKPRSDAARRSIRRLSRPGAEDPTRYLHQIVSQMYDIRLDDMEMRSLIDSPRDEISKTFRSLRRNYPDRHYFDTYELKTGPSGPITAAQLRDGLGIRVR